MAQIPRPETVIAFTGVGPRRAAWRWWGANWSRISLASAERLRAGGAKVQPTCTCGLLALHPKTAACTEAA